MSEKSFKIYHPQMMTPLKFFKSGHPQNVCKMLKISPNAIGNYSSYVKILESQDL